MLAFIPHAAASRCCWQATTLWGRDRRLGLQEAAHPGASRAAGRCAAWHPADFQPAGPAPFGITHHGKTSDEADRSLLRFEPPQRLYVLAGINMTSCVGSWQERGRTLMPPSFALIFMATFAASKAQPREVKVSQTLTQARDFSAREGADASHTAQQPRCSIILLRAHRSTGRAAWGARRCRPARHHKQPSHCEGRGTRVLVSCTTRNAAKDLCATGTDVHNLLGARQLRLEGCRHNVTWLVPDSTKGACKDSGEATLVATKHWETTPRTPSEARFTSLYSSVPVIKARDGDFKRVSLTSPCLSTALPSLSGSALHLRDSTAYTARHRGSTSLSVLVGFPGPT